MQTENLKKVSQRSPLSIALPQSSALGFIHFMVQSYADELGLISIASMTRNVLEFMMMPARSHSASRASTSASKERGDDAEAPPQSADTEGGNALGDGVGIESCGPVATPAIEFTHRSPAPTCGARPLCAPTCLLSTPPQELEFVAAATAPTFGEEDGSIATASKATEFCHREFTKCTVAEDERGASIAAWGRSGAEAATAIDAFSPDEILTGGNDDLA